MSRNWRLLETGLRFCAHTGRVQDKNSVAVLDRAVLGWDRVVLRWIVQCSWIGFCRRLWQYLTSFAKYWIVFGYMRYM